MGGEGHYAECVSDIQKTLERMPKYLETYASLGDAYSHLHETEKSMKAFQALTERDVALSDLLRNKYPEIQESYLQTMKAAPVKS